MKIRKSNGLYYWFNEDELIQIDINKIIYENLSQNDTYLDLGSLGLNEVPEEIKAIRTLTNIDLSFNELDHLPDWLFEFNYLIDIDLSFNRFSELPLQLFGMKSLLKVSLSYNRIYNAKFWSFENSTLEILDLSNNGLQEIPKNISEFIGIRRLILRGNKISSLPNWIDNLKKLNAIDLSKNQIRKFPDFSSFKFLQGLDLRSNNIHILPKSINRLKNLQKLGLSDNKLRQLPNEFGKLKKIQKLSLSRNDFTKVPDCIQGLENLNNFSIAECNIKDIPVWFKDMNNLKTIDFSKTQITDLFNLKDLLSKGLRIEVKTFDNIWSTGLLIAGCNVKNPPPEILKQGSKSVLNYWEQISVQGTTEELNEVKLIIVGEGATGKTTLFNKLTIPNYIVKGKVIDETHGINIYEGLEYIHKSEVEFKLFINIWDFGGQEIQYMTHQFFLTPKSLYVLMMDSRREAPNLPYWLKIVSLLGKDELNPYEKIPLLLVFNNRKDKPGKSPQYHDILRYYENDLDASYIEVDLGIDGLKWDYLKNSIFNNLANLPIVKSPVPKQWKPIRDALRKEALSNNSINFNRFSQICSKFNIKNEEDQLLLSSYFHQLGTILHFQRDNTLFDFIILKPEWAVKGVYSVLKNKEIEKNKGRFCESEIYNILKDEGYSRMDTKKILQLMSKSKFDICYKSSKNSFVAAQLLPEDAPSYKWHNEDGSLKFRFLYPFMPKGLISRLIVRLSEHLDKNSSGEEIVWKKGGVFLFNKDGFTSRILVKEDDSESQSGLRQIIIDVLGDRYYRKYALQKIRDEIQTIHNEWFNNIKYEEKIPCCCSICKNNKEPELFTLNKLLMRKLKRLDESCDLSGEDILISHLLEGVYSESEIIKFNTNK